MKKGLLIAVVFSVLSFGTQAAPDSSQSAKPTAFVLHAATLRDRPRQGSQGEVVAPADTRVRLEKMTQNVDGTWWFVTANGLGGGWVLESEMGSPHQE